MTDELLKLQEQEKEYNELVSKLDESFLNKISTTNNRSDYYDITNSYTTVKKYCHDKNFDLHSVSDVGERISLFDSLNKNISKKVDSFIGKGKTNNKVLKKVR